MKRYITVFAIMFLITFSLSIYADDYKSNAKDDIGKAQKIQEKLLKDKDLQEYIPYDLYHSAADNLKQAAYQYDEEKEYAVASYYGVLSLVEFETAKITAETRLLKYKTVLAEKDQYMNAAKKEMLKAAVAGAGLSKTGKSYKANAEDISIFKSGTLTITESGERILNEIYKVVKLYPESKLLIKGHTGKQDNNNSKSEQKANKISEYFKVTKGMDEKRIEVKGVGNQEPLEIGGKEKRVDRIEVIIIGVE